MRVEAPQCLPQSLCRDSGLWDRKPTLGPGSPFPRAELLVLFREVPEFSVVDFADINSRQGGEPGLAPDDAEV